MAGRVTRKSGLPDVRHQISCGSRASPASGAIHVFSPDALQKDVGARDKRRRDDGKPRQLFRSSGAARISDQYTLYLEFGA